MISYFELTAKRHMRRKNVLNTHIALIFLKLFMYLLKPVFKHICTGNYQNEVMYQTKTQISMVDMSLSKIHVPSCSHVMAASM